MSGFEYFGIAPTAVAVLIVSVPVSRLVEWILKIDLFGRNAK